jgi:hypothetical protein
MLSIKKDETTLDLLTLVTTCPASYTDQLIFDLLVGEFPVRVPLVLQPACAVTSWGLPQPALILPLPAACPAPPTINTGTK